MNYSISSASTLLIVFAAILIFQALTWAELKRIRQDIPDPNPPSCSSRNPCFVELTRPTAFNEIGGAVAAQMKK